MHRWSRSNMSLPNQKHSKWMRESKSQRETMPRKGDNKRRNEINRQDSVPPNKNKKPTTPGIPRRSPIQVLTGPYAAWLRWSDENRYIQHGMVVGSCSFKVKLFEHVKENWWRHQRCRPSPCFIGVFIHFVNLWFELLYSLSKGKPIHRPIPTEKKAVARESQSSY